MPRRCQREIESSDMSFETETEEADRGCFRSQLDHLTGADIHRDLPVRGVDYVFFRNLLQQISPTNVEKDILCRSLRQ